MKPIKDSIVVSIDLAEKDRLNDGRLTGYRYSENYRERSPVLAYVEQGISIVPRGTFLVCNYNHFEINSPFHLKDNLFVIPVDEEIFATIDIRGNAHPICGNIIVERVKKEIPLLPIDYQKNYDDRGKIVHSSHGFKRGDFVFWMPMSDYEIVYFWKGEEKRVVKVFHKEIVGILKK